MLQFLKNLLMPEWFMPHGYCYLWKPDLVSLHVLSDASIALAYYSIPIILGYFVYQRRDVPFRGIFLLFGAFIISCGTTHLMEIWTLWHPAYWLSGVIKAGTAFVSWYAAVRLVSLIPQALSLKSPLQLEAANQKLAREIVDRQLVEAALQESEIRFRSIFEAAAMGISLVSPTGVIITSNPALQQMLGYSESELREISYQELTHPEDVSNSRQLYEELLAGSCSHCQSEKRYIRKDGQMLWAHLTISLVRNVEGEPQFFICMVEDITGRKKTEESLRQYQEHLEELVGERTIELTKVNEQLSWQASHDPLTGLINRYEFEQRLEAAVLAAKNSYQEHTLCYLDLDRFKIVNDTCGHFAGDELLRQVSILLQERCRKTDVLARLGGDEFALLLVRCPLESGLGVALSLHESIQGFRFVCQEKTFSVGVSIGLVPIDANAIDADSIMTVADAACYAAKNRGRNRVHIYQANDVELVQQRTEVEWAVRINEAIAHHRFRLYYQQIVSLNVSSECDRDCFRVAEEYCPRTIACDGTILPSLDRKVAPCQSSSEHYEVLVRLLDENGELIPPMAFIPAAERYNLMPIIDRWVIRTFFACLRQQGRQKWDDCLYALNLSGASINDDEFVGFIKEQLLLQEIPPQAICFEITETYAIANLSKASQLIRELKALGCRFSLDDFGSGMSSFGYLKHLPVDFIKIDGCFIKDIVDDPMTFAMVESINRIGHVIGLKTVAEFVSNSMILEKVKLLGVDYAQGYGIAKPLPLPILDFRLV